MQGAKLCMLADMLGSTGSLTGVDVAKHRLSACRTMLQKYSLGDRTRLFVADGTLFSILPVNSNLRRMEGILVLKNSCSFLFFLVLEHVKGYTIVGVDLSSCYLSQGQLALKKMEVHSQNGLRGDHGRIGRRLRN
jgi:ubiquinone/menaquinone biosynthesis C-methylase UbiE